MTSVGERPRLLIVAGPNGSGKTTVTERGLARDANWLPAMYPEHAGIHA